MQIQINTDANIDGNESLRQHVTAVLESTLERFGNRVTRVEVHLSDESSAAKSRNNDKRCLMEVRLAGLKPIAVTHETDTVHQAVDGAAEKLEKILDRTIGKLADARRVKPEIAEPAEPEE
jgi:ribosomal subunit interface protein